MQTQAETFGRSLFAGQVNDSSISNTQYVTNLYEGFLQRGPDAGGLSWWSGQASVGTGRQNVLNAFATCSAFRELSGTLYREANWLVADQLGTPRMIVNKSGALTSVKRHDYLPFGEELSAGIGGRTTTQGYSGDSVRQKFTSKERDNETGLDYFGARYYGSTQGRFTSTDPASFKLSNLANPQDLNRYGYVANNPLRFIDPTGEEKIQVMITTFIPQPVVVAPAGEHFEGDNRSPGEPGGFRTQQVVVVETDPTKNGGNPLVSYTRDTGITHELNYNGEVIRQGQASGSTLEVAVRRDRNGTLVIQAKGNESDPLLIGAPGITFDFNIAISSPGTSSDATVQVSGAHDGFPGYEIIVDRQEVKDHKSVLVYPFDPRKTGGTVTNLFPPMDVSGNLASVTIPGSPPQKPPQTPPPSRRRERRGRHDD